MGKINSIQSVALLWFTIMNQSQKSKNIIKNVPLLFGRLGIDQKFMNFTYEEIYNAMINPTSLHRFPKKMSIYLFESLITICDKFDGNPSNIFVEREAVIKNLLSFKGIGEHKANIAFYIYESIMAHKILFPYQLQCNINQEDICEELTYIDSLKNVFLHVN